MASTLRSPGAKKPTIHKEGWLWKKSPSGIRGFRQWQKRWFTITDKAILYSKKQEDTEPLGVIPLLQIVDAEYLPEKRVGCRFDVRVKNLRVYALHGTGMEDAKAWTHAINEAMIRARSDGGSATSRKANETSVKLTKLQALFARARAGGEIGKGKEEQKAQLTLKAQFPTDGDLLKHILHSILHPKNAIFDFDMADEKDDTLDPEDADARALEEKKTAAGTGASADTGSGEDKAKCSVECCNALADEASGACQWHRDRERFERKASPPASPSNGSGKQGGVLALTPPQKAAVVEMLFSKEFLRHLCDVFNTDDHVAQGYAVRIMWCLFRGIYGKKEASEQFASYIQIYGSGPRFKMEIKGALLRILLQTPINVVEQTEDLTISFYMPVHNPVAWPALLHCLNESDFNIRKSALEDINTILHDNFDNCRSLRRNKNWQAWVYSIICDIPKSQNQDPVLKTVYAYCVNVVTLVHFQYYMKKEFFDEVITDSLWRLHQFGGSTSESCRVASTMLAALCSKLASQKKTFSSDKDATEWRNLTKLTGVIRRFVFQSAYWQTNAGVRPPPDAQDERKEEGPDGSGGSQLRLGGGGATVNVDQRNKVLQAAREKGSEYLLYKCRVGKHERSFRDEPELTDFGIHWTDEGRASDIVVVNKVLELFKALNIHEFHPDLNPTLSTREKDFLKAAVQEYNFWVDSKTFLELPERQDIDEHKLLSYRKMSFLCQSWLEANLSKSGRKSVLSDIKSALKDRQKVLSAKKQAAAATTASTSAIAPAAAAAGKAEGKAYTGKRDSSNGQGKRKGRPRRKSSSSEEEDEDEDEEAPSSDSSSESTSSSSSEEEEEKPAPHRKAKKAQKKKESSSSGESSSSEEEDRRRKRKPAAKKRLAKSKDEIKSEEEDSDEAAESKPKRSKPRKKRGSDSESEDDLVRRKSKSTKGSKRTSAVRSSRRAVSEGEDSDDAVDRKGPAAARGHHTLSGLDLSQLPPHLRHQTKQQMRVGAESDSD